MAIPESATFRIQKDHFVFQDEESPDDGEYQVTFYVSETPILRADNLTDMGYILDNFANFVSACVKLKPMFNGDFS